MLTPWRDGSCVAVSSTRLLRVAQRTTWAQRYSHHVKKLRWTSSCWHVMLLLQLLRGKYQTQLARVRPSWHLPHFLAGSAVPSACQSLLALSQKEHSMAGQDVVYMFFLDSSCLVPLLGACFAIANSCQAFMHIVPLSSTASTADMSCRQQLNA